MTEETNIADTLKLSVAKAIEKAQLMDSASLVALLAAEEAGQKRTTLIDWLKGEQAERAEVDRRTNEAANPKIYSQKEADAVVAAATDELRAELTSTGDALSLSQRQDSEAQATIAQLREQVATLQSENDRLNSLTVAVPSLNDDAGASVLSGAASSDDRIPALDRVSGDGFDGFIPSTGVAVFFVDTDDRRIDTIDAQRFGPSSFRRSGRSATLDADIEFEPGMGEVEIAAAVLVEFERDDLSSALARSTLVMPFAVGGGRNAKLPAGTLTFRA